MKKTTYAPRELLRIVAPSIIPLLFYVGIGWALMTAELPSVKPLAFVTRRWLLAGQEFPFKAQDPGRFFSIFDPYRPATEKVSFLTDTDPDPRHPEVEKIQAAQGQLAPLLLTAAPQEDLAFFFCSNKTIAEARLKASGYRLTRVLGDGKGVAEKIR